MSKIKVCGLYRPEDIVAVNEAKPDFCGFIINFPKSHRNVTPEKLRELSAMVDSSITRVGVFVNSEAELVCQLLNDNVIDIAQLHGSEDDAFIEKVQKNTCKKVIKYFKIESEADIEKAKQSKADYILLDNGLGTGKAFDWSIVKNVGREFFLAGGLGPDNLAEAIKTVAPFAVDMSSSLETDKVKDPAKIKLAVDIVRNN